MSYEYDHHQRMGEAGEAWEVEEHSSPSILDTVLIIGKKMVITGVVISSTPFILPSIIVISAFGFALSIPAGILLSSYLCTEKLMSKLLPIKPEYPLMLEGANEEAKEEIKSFEREYIDIEEKRDDDSAKTDRPLDHDIVIEDANLEEKKVEERESGEEKIPAEETKGEEMKESENEKKADDIVAEKTIINGTEKNNKSAKKKKGNKKNHAGVAHEEPEKKREEEKVAPTTKTEARDTSERRGSEKVPRSKQTAAATTAGKEVVLSEEKILEKLDALRAILGYKASPHKTYIGELKALYMSAGVDLPSSLKDWSDLVEVNDKLVFLMSIVGVK